MKSKKVLFALASSLMLLGLVSPKIAVHKEYIEPDNVEYSDPLVVSYDKPTLIHKAAKVTSASSVTINYHNDDGKCGTREFWIWCDGVMGSAFKPTVKNNGKDMSIHMDFTGEYANFAGKKGIYFIVKEVGTWVGQSDNMFVDYGEYPPNASGLTEVWCIPGEGNAVEMYASEEDTKMDRFQLATFKDWKTISIIATAVPQTYRLYALTGNYMKIASVATQEDLDRYLIVEGSNPTCKDVTYNSTASKQFEIKLNYTARVNVQYYLEGVFPKYQKFTKTKYVSFHELYETSRFEKYYNYTGDDLGATWIDEKTTKFKVWAPTAARVRLFIYKSGTNAELAEELGISGSDDYVGYDMAFQPGGVWEVTLTGKDFHGSYYNYYVVNSLGKVVATDPYAKACGVNGERGMVCDFSRTNPEGWDEIPTKWDGVSNFDIKSPNELSVYETHIRDLTMDKTWKGKSTPGTYSAFVEGGTSYTSNDVTVTTGFDHLKELGVKAIQLEPVFDSDNLEPTSMRSYNWGYNPLNYNCVDGSYATDPYKGASRVKEFKSLVQAFANNGNHTRVIMDVVYNHVASAPASCFNKLMPKYYFRYAADGTYYDGSGCGNEVKTNAPMMRKYVVESLCWWASEYKIKGFRFDLMGLIDVTTMDEARKALYKIDPDIVLYGEGWTGDGSGYDWSTGTAYAVHGAANPTDPKLLGCVTKVVYSKLNPIANTCYVGAFNDQGRNAIRGDNNLSWGFINQGSGDVGDKSKTVADMMVGYHTGMGGNPNQCVNYASCHDNYTLVDQMTATIIDGGGAKDMGLVYAAVTAIECSIMFSNGIAFIQGGEEVFRSKAITTEEDKANAKESDTHKINGQIISHNSYNLSDAVNGFKWDRKISIGSITTKDYVAELAKAIKLRNSLKKYSYDDLQKANPYSSTSKMNVWNQGDGSTSIAMKNDTYFFFLAGCNNDTIPFGAYFDAGYTKQAFCSNPKAGGFVPDAENNGIKLGWYTCVCLTHN